MNQVRIGTRFIGEGQPCLIVAELGLNHGGDVRQAETLIRVAADLKADAVKLQKRSPEALLAPEGLAAPYSGPHAFGETYGAHRLALELPQLAWIHLQEVAHSLGLLFFASAWDKPSVEFLEALDVPCHKIPSACLTDDLLLDYVAQKGRPVILSTGMSGWEEVLEAVHIVYRHGAPLILLQCTSTYPATPANLNLRVMDGYRTAFGCPVGYSGHELSLAPSFAAVARGACLLERHLTLDRGLKGPDHRASLEPEEFRVLVEGVREVEAALGDGIKRCLPSELPAKTKLGKSLVIRSDVRRRGVLLPEHVELKEPGTGVPAGQWAGALGSAARVDLPPGTVVLPVLLKRRPFWSRLWRLPALVRSHYRMLKRLNPRRVACREAMRMAWVAIRPLRRGSSG